MLPAPSRPALLLLLLLAAGCASGPLVRDAPDLLAPAGFPDHSAEQVLERMEAVAARDSIAAFSAQSKLQLRSPERNADLDATIRHREADTLWASVRGPLGIEVARARATPDSFAVHDRMNGRLYVGPVAAAAGYLPTPTDTRALFGTLLGTLRPERGPAWALRADDRYYHLTDAATQRVFTVDPASWRTVRFQSFVEGVLVDERSFSAFDVVDGRILPRRVELRDPRGGLRLTVEQRRLTLNPDALDFPLSFGDADVHPIE